MTFPSGVLVLKRSSKLYRVSEAWRLTTRSTRRLRASRRLQTDASAAPRGPRVSASVGRIWELLMRVFGGMRETAERGSGGDRACEAA
jgi:hypothetical protein